MADKENNVKQEKVDIDFSMFIGDEGANVLSTEQLKEIKKKLPKWSIMPPSKSKEQ